MNKYQKAIDTLKTSEIKFHVYKGQTEEMEVPRMFDLYHHEIFILEELTELATPKKPKVIPTNYHYIELECPNCKKVTCTNFRRNYCGDCGQALDWSEEE